MPTRSFHRAAARLLVLLPAAALLGSCDEAAAPTHQRVTLGDRAFRLELAVTSRQIATGLMHRESLPEDGGMLFVFPEEAPRSFWMKNCLIPLDLIYLDGRGRIVSMTTMAVPDPEMPDDELPRYPSRWPAQFAIEVAAGTADKRGLEVGDRIGLPLERLKQLAR